MLFNKLRARKDTFLTVFLIASLFVVAFPVLAQSSSGISFGIRPTKAIEGQEETFSYFSYRVTPGSSFQDEALVLNGGAEPVTLKIYAADGVTAQNGGTSFTQEGVLSTGYSKGVHSWISLSSTEVTLLSGEEKKIAFQVSIPADISPGQYVAGLLVEALPEEQEVLSGADDEAQFLVNTVRRVGVAVVLEVPGERVLDLAINNIVLHEQNETGTVFAVNLENKSTVFLQPEGFFVVTDRDGDRLITTIPLSFETILPGDVVTFYVPRAARFADGQYLLSVLLDYEGKKAVLEGVGVTIKNGQPKIEGVVSEGVFSPEEIEIFFEKEARSPQSLWLIVAGASFILALIAGGFVYWMGGRRQQEV